MSKQREPSLGLLLGIAFVIFLNSVVIVLSIAMFIFTFVSFIAASGRIEAILFIIVAILNLIAVAVVRKSRFLIIVRRVAIVGNALFIFLAFQMIMSDDPTMTLLCFGAAAANIAGIMYAPIEQYQLGLICPECDYDLRGLKNRGCPECGWKRKN